MATFLGWNKTSTGGGEAELQAVFRSKSGQLTALGEGAMNALTRVSLGDPDSSGVGFFDHEPGEVITQTNMKFALANTGVKYRP